MFGSNRQLRLGNRRLKVSPAFVDDKRWQCRCFVEEVSHAWREWRDRNNPWRLEKDGKKLPVVIFEGGRRWQYVSDGERIHTVEVDEEELRNGEGRDDGELRKMWRGPRNCVTETASCLA